MSSIDVRPPSEKQYDYASLIAETLELPLPSEFSVSAYSDFINHYQNRFKKESQRYDEILDDDDNY